MSELWSVLRQPRWLGMLAALPALMALCLVAANWQYERHVQRSQAEHLLSLARESPPADLASALPTEQDLAAGQRYTSVRVRGTYEPGTVLVRNRSLGGERGVWVVTPLRTDRGPEILVLRGFQGTSSDDADGVGAPAAPTGPVTVTGMLQPSEPKRGAGILSNGEATSLNVSTLCPANDCYRPYLQASSSDPADTVEPIPVMGPGLGPHLGYAGQWLIFAILLPVGYAVLLRREVQHSRVSSVPAPMP